MPRSRTPRTIVGVTAFLIVLWIAASLGWLASITAPLSRFFVSATAPLHDATVAATADDAADTASLSADELRRRFERVSVENARLRNAMEEAEALKAALGYRDRFDDVLLAARVISSLQDPIDASFLIDRGSADGVIAGQAVIIDDGVLVGKVTEVGTHTARVRSLTDSRSAVAVTIRTGQGTVGVLNGDRGLSLHITLIPQSEILTPGDVVITSGLEPGIRRGLLVGTIEKVTRETQGPFQTATVLPFLGARRPTFVQILSAGADVTDAGTL